MKHPYLVCLMLALLEGGCVASGAPAGPRPVPAASPEAPPSREALTADVERRKAGTSGLNRLGFEVFGTLQGQNPTQNLALSPASLGRALLMAYAGARGTTREAMATALGLPDQSEETLGNWAAATGPSMDKRGVAIQVSDAAWIRSDFQVQPSFTEALSRMFSAEVGAFSDPDDGTAKLRAWVKRATKGLLDGEGFQLESEVRLAFANVLTFDGRWDEVFPKTETRPRPFFASPSQSRQVPTMYRSGEFKYAEDEGYQVIRLPYQQSAYAMYVVLALDSVAASPPMDVERFGRLADKVTKNRGEIWLPRFSLKDHFSLTAALKASGLGLAFSDDADFSGIAPALRLDKVDQQVRVEVDEEGTVAAAATLVTAVPTSVIVYPKPFSMEVNRPFYFAIREDTTQAVLFLGRVARPD